MMIERSLDWEALFLHPKSIGRFAANLAGMAKEQVKERGLRIYAIQRHSLPIPKT
jgi:hypothetical protein